MRSDGALSVTWELGVEVHAEVAGGGDADTKVLRVGSLDALQWRENGSWASGARAETVGMCVQLVLEGGRLAVEVRRECGVGVGWLGGGRSLEWRQGTEWMLTCTCIR